MLRPESLSDEISLILPMPSLKLYITSFLALFASDSAAFLVTTFCLLTAGLNLNTIKSEYKVLTVSKFSFTVSGVLVFMLNTFASSLLKAAFVPVSCGSGLVVEYLLAVLVACSSLDKLEACASVFFAFGVLHPATAVPAAVTAPPAKSKAFNFARMPGCFFALLLLPVKVSCCRPIFFTCK